MASSDHLKLHHVPKSTESARSIYHSNEQAHSIFISKQSMTAYRNRGTTFQMTEKSDSGDMAVLPPCHTAIRVLRSSSTSSLNVTANQHLRAVRLTRCKLVLQNDKNTQNLGHLSKSVPIS